MGLLAYFATFLLTFKQSLKHIEHMLKLFTHPVDRIETPVDTTPSPLTRPAKVGLPRLSELDDDFVSTNAVRRCITLGRPFAALALYVMFASIGWWIPALVCTVVAYATAIVCVHDLMHRNLGLGRRAIDLALMAAAGLVGEAGHVLRVTHQQHHRAGTPENDPEAYLEQFGPIRALVEGPMYRHFLACWAWKNRPGLRRWIAVEAVLSLAAITAALVIGRQVPVFGFWVLTVVLFSWVFPFVSVTWLHGSEDEGALNSARTIRGIVIPRLTLGMTYHLEHHLYPQVPSHRIAALSKVIDERLQAAGAIPQVLI